jgi:indolepyruvate ferredoxin oxidoreductase beta subunit
MMQSDQVINIKIAGLGGMGVLTAAGILAETAFRAGHDVKRSELHGMSQRGGSVSSDIRFGKKVFSPMIPDGEIDYLLLMAEDQMDVFRPDLRRNGEIIASAIFKSAALPHKKVLNIAMLGALSIKLDFHHATWLEVLRKTFGKELVDINIAGFDLGRAIMSQAIAGKQP